MNFLSEKTNVSVGWKAGEGDTNPPIEESNLTKRDVTDLLALAEEAVARIEEERRRRL